MRLIYLIPWFRVLCCGSLLFLSQVAIHGQAQTPEVFASVPPVLRERLSERLKLLVHYQSSQQWEKHYELLFRAVVDGVSKEAYAGRNRDWYTKVAPDELIVDFTPTATIAREPLSDSGWWTIYGCAKFRKKGLLVDLRSSVDAYRDAGEWYFSDVGAITPVDGKPQPCQSSRSLSAPSTPGQVRDENVFVPVPAPLRARLIERLKLLVEHQRAQQWDKQYDLLSVLVTQGDSKEDHVKRLRYWYAEGLGDMLVDFTPKSLTYQGGGPSDVVIFGCAKVRENESIKELYASVEAYRERGEWYFSTIGVVTPVDGKPRSCEPSKSTSSQACSLSNY